jgi:xylulokinase
MVPDHVLAIDLGTGGPKVGLVSVVDGSIADHDVAAVDLELLAGGGAEQDPDQWWAAIVEATGRMMARGVVVPGAVAGVAVTSQWMGTVAVDARGRHLHNAVIWMDSRGAPYVRDLTRGRLNVAGYDPRKLRRWLHHTKGVPSQTGKDPLGHLLFLRHERPDVYEAAHCFLEPVDYLNLRLTGRMAASFDTITGHWLTDTADLDMVHYVPELLEMAGIDRAKLPDLLPTGSVLGPLVEPAASGLGLPAGIPVVMGTADTCSAAIGSGAVADNAPHLYIGTSSWLSCHVPWRRVDPLHTMTALPSAIPGRYLLATEQETAGACLTHLIDNVLYPDDGLSVVQAPDALLDRLNDLAASVAAGSGGVIYLPWLNGEKTPVDDHLVRGGWLNVSLTTTRAHMVRSMLEGVALNTRWMHHYVERFAGERMDDIAFVGGGADSALWAQILADVLDRRIRPVLQPRLANVRGAGLAAAVALGHLRWEDVGALVPYGETREPDPANRAVYDAHYEAFASLYRRNKGVFASLNGTGRRTGAVRRASGAPARMRARITRTGRDPEHRPGGRDH